MSKLGRAYWEARYGAYCRDIERRKVGKPIPFEDYLNWHKVELDE